MSGEEHVYWGRRKFLGRAMLAGTAGIVGVQSARLIADLLGSQSRALAAEPPPETSTIRLWRGVSACQGPANLAEEFVRQEGFTNVQYVRITGELLPRVLASGEVDIGMSFAGPSIIRLDAGDPLVLLAGGHVGCFELVASSKIRTIRDLKGKTVAVTTLGGNRHVFLSILAASVGLNPAKDINWVTHPLTEWERLLVEEKVDAVMALPPMGQEFRAKKIGHVVVNSMMERPWNQYFCCMVGVHRDFLAKHPIATKRALRAFLKTSDRIAREPAWAAKQLVAKGFSQRYDYTLQLMREIPYGQWRDYDPEDTLRFYALRLREVGMITSAPQKIIAQGTDWRFLKELKKEMKA